MNKIKVMDETKEGKVLVIKQTIKFAPKPVYSMSTIAHHLMIAAETIKDGKYLRPSANNDVSYQLTETLSKFFDITIDGENTRTEYVGLDDVISFIKNEIQSKNAIELNDLRTKVSNFEREKSKLIEDYNSRLDNYINTKQKEIEELKSSINTSDSPVIETKIKIPWYKRIFNNIK